MNWYKFLKWRFLLLTIGVALSFLLNAVGDKQIQTAEARIAVLNAQGGHFYIPVYWAPPAHIIDNCLNAPANVVRNRLWKTGREGEYRAGFYMAVGIFWFSLGWILDARGWFQRWGIAPLSANVLGVVLSVKLGHHGVNAIHAGVYISAVQNAIMVWSLALTALFAWQIFMGFRQRFTVPSLLANDRQTL